MNFNDPTDYDQTDETSSGWPPTSNGEAKKTKPNRPHYKELFEDQKHSVKILVRCAIGLGVALAASLALNIVLINQLKP